MSSPRGDLLVVPQLTVSPDPSETKQAVINVGRKFSQDLIARL